MHTAHNLKITLFKHFSTYTDPQTPLEVGKTVFVALAEVGKHTEASLYSQTVHVHSVFSHLLLSTISQIRAPQSATPNITNPSLTQNYKYHCGLSLSAHAKATASCFMSVFIQSVTSEFSFQASSQRA